MEKNNLMKVIKAEHQQVNQDFTVLKRGLGAKQSMFESLLTRIREHFAKEEKMLFEKLQKHSRLSGEATSALQQDHQAILKQFDELNTLTVSNTDWTVKVEQLAEALEEHFKYEEETYFKFVKAGFSKAELEEMVGEAPDRKPEKAEPKKTTLKAVKKPAVKKTVKKAPTKNPSTKKETIKKTEKKQADKKSSAKSVTKKTTTKAKTTPSK